MFREAANRIVCGVSLSLRASIRYKGPLLLSSVCSLLFTRNIHELTPDDVDLGPSVTAQARTSLLALLFLLV